MEQKNQCELCGGDSLTLLYKLKGFNIKRCNKCNLVFRDVLLSSQEAGELYGEGYFTSEQKDYFFNNIELKKKIFTDKLQRLDSLYPQKGDLLDVGCSIGTSLVCARELGWNVKGVEVSEFASEYARKNYNLDVLTGELENQDLEPNSFDVITLWDVIDHIEKPQAFLKHLFSLLKPNSIVIVETTMEDSLLYRIAHYLYVLSGGLFRWPAARCHPIHHTTFYSTDTLRLALEKAGFKVIKTESGDLNSELINTNVFTKMILKIISSLASKLNRPLETVFYAKK